MYHVYISKVEQQLLLHTAFMTFPNVKAALMVNTLTCEVFIKKVSDP